MPDPRAKDLFNDALERDEPEREAFLTAACGDEPELLAEVRRLLGAFGRAPELATPPLAPAMPGAPAAAARPGLRIADYELLEVLGEGGFATVWRARQERPVVREVALKLLKPGLISPAAVQRFDAERQALARLDHPGLAKLFDGGLFEGRQPWFAMELVDGRTITEHCDAAGLDVRRRLELFLGVTDAVSHAHRRGILHRDLKPSNVLVVEGDGDARPLVIDFGIAKAVGTEELPAGDLTLEGQVLGTPATMAPEQAAGSNDLDTRVDVYALGSLLYELLTGAQVIDRGTLGSASLVEVLRAVREDRPPLASVRAAEQHPDRARQLRGDLDWVLERALEKDRERRYGSVSEFAAELRRHLRDVPVLAGPPDLAYRAAKFARRHAGALTAAGLVAVTLLVGIGVSATQAVRARAAESLLADEVDAKTVELVRYRSLALFLEELLLGVDPAFAQGKDTELLRGILASAAERVEAESDGLPAVEATLRRVIGGAYMKLGEFEAAEEQLALALELRDAMLDPDDVDRLVSVHELGSLYGEQGRLAEAEPLLAEALERRRRVEGPTDERTLRTWTNYVVVRRAQGHLQEAEAGFRGLAETQRALRGADHESTLWAENNWAGVLGELGRREEACELYASIVERQLRTLGPRHIETLMTLNNLGHGLTALERHAEAAEPLARALEIKRGLLPDGHPSLTVSLSNVARNAEALGDPARAEALYAEAADMAERTATTSTTNALLLLHNRAAFLERAERFGEAEADRRLAVERATETFGPEHRLTLTLEGSLGWLLHEQGAAAEAERVLGDVADRAEAALPQEDPELALHQVRHGLAAAGTNPTERSAERLRTSLPGLRAAGGERWVRLAEAALAAGDD